MNTHVRNTVLGGVLLSVCSMADTSFGAATVAGNVNSDTFVYTSTIDSTGTLVPSGSGYAAVGTFTLSDALLGVGGAGAVLADFEEFVSTSFGGESVGDADGIFLSTFSAIIPDSFNGRGVYVVYGDGSDLLSSTQFAAINTGNVFPDDDPTQPVPLEFNVDVSNLTADQLIVGNFVAGVPSPVIGPDTSSGNSVQMVLIPEPSVLSLGLAAIGLLFIRRRRV